MLPPKLLLILFVLSLALLLNSCATMPPDVPVGVELAPNAGYLIWTMSNKEQLVDDTHLYNGHTWWEMRPAMVLVPASSWAELKIFIIQICKETKRCSQITNWQRSVNGIDSKLSEKSSFSTDAD